MANEPFRHPLTWENVRKESLVASKRQKAIENARSATERARAEGNGFWWDAQKYVDQVVPAEYVNPDKFDTFNYRYQVYARAPPVQCLPRCLGEISEEKPPVQYNVKRISREKFVVSETYECDTRRSQKPWDVVTGGAGQEETLDISKNNNAVEKRPFVTRHGCLTERLDTEPLCFNEFPDSTKASSSKLCLLSNTSKNTSLPPVIGARRLQSVEKRVAGRQLINNNIALDKTASGLRMNEFNTHEGEQPKSNKSNIQGVSGRRRTEVAPLAAKDNISCLLREDSTENANNSSIQATEMFNWNVFIDVFVLETSQLGTSSEETNDLQVQRNKRRYSKRKPPELYAVKTADKLSKNNNATVHVLGGKEKSANMFQPVCSPVVDHSDISTCQLPIKLSCHPAKSNGKMLVDKLAYMRKGGIRDLQNHNVNENRHTPFDQQNERCKVFSNKNWHEDPKPNLEPDPGRKTPEIGYETYKIVGSRQFKQRPPPDLTKSVRMKPHLEEYLEFARRCPNYATGRYDKADPRNEMLLPSNRDPQNLKGSLSPYVYTRNVMVMNLPPLFDEDDIVEGLEWSLPSFVLAQT